MNKFCDELWRIVKFILITGLVNLVFTIANNVITNGLVASRSIERRENAPLSLEEIEAIVFADPNPFPPLSVELVMLLFLPVAGVCLAVRTLWRITHKTVSKKRKKSTAKPQNRFYR